MVVEVTVKGYFEENTFFYIDDKTKHGFVIDPGAQGEELLNLIHKNGWVIEKVLLTHGHFDHTGAVEYLRKTLNIPVMAHRRSDEYLLDTRMNLSAYCGQNIVIENIEYLDDKDRILLSGNPETYLDVIYSPGHTTDSVIFYSAKDTVAFVGDTIFKGSIGNTQYPGGNGKELRRSIIEKVFSLPEETILYSGHSEQTTVGKEKYRYRFQ
jgi:hydroxyacylglutathione hydrolase